MGKTIELKAADGHNFDAYVAEPAGKPRGAVVVIQEIFGVNSHIRSVADGYAADGYLAVAPAMFDRVQRRLRDRLYAAGDPGRHRAQGGRSTATNTRCATSQAAIDHAANGRQGRHRRLLLGRHSSPGARLRSVTGLAAAVAVLRRRHDDDLKDEQPKVPMMCHFGEHGPLDPARHRRRTSRRRTPRSRCTSTRAGHGFNCDQRGSYNADAAKLARERTLEFFRKHLG